MTHRAAVIGCGGISRAHAQAFAAVDEVSIVAAADPREDARERFAAEIGVERTYADAMTMMASEQPDVVSVCTWPTSHPELTEIACEGGARLVICEKPMADDLAGADRMLAAAKQAGSLLLINHQRRFTARFAKARELLDAGAIGDVRQLTGKAPMDIRSTGTHMLDLIRFLVDDDPVYAVFAAIDTTPLPLFCAEFVEHGTFYGDPVETAAMVDLLFEAGMRAHLEMGELAREPLSVTIDGSAGRIEIGGEGSEAPGGVPLRYRTDDSGWIMPELAHRDDQMAESLRVALNVLQRGGRHPLDAVSGRADLEIMLAIYESARRRRIVRLPLLCAGSPLDVMLEAGEIQSNRPPAFDLFERITDETGSEELERIAQRLLDECLRLPGAEVATWHSRVFGPPLSDSQFACLERYERLYKEQPAVVGPRGGAS